MRWTAEQRLQQPEYVRLDVAVRQDLKCPVVSMLPPIKSCIAGSAFIGDMGNSCTRDLLEPFSRHMQQRTGAKVSRNCICLGSVARLSPVS